MDQKGIDDFLLGIAEATNALVSLKLEEGLIIALRTLTENLQVTTSGVYVNELDDTGSLVYSLKYFYSIEPSQQRVQNNQKIPFTQFQTLYKALDNGRSFEGIFSESEGLLRQHMEADQTMSVALFPVMVKGELWGALSISDMEVERRWSISEKSLLLSLANSVGAAIEREKLETELEEKVRQRTAELEESRIRFQLAIEGTQNGLWDWQPQKGEVFWSENMYKNLGYQPGELDDLVDGFYDLVHPDERAEAKRRYDAYLNERIPYEMEFRLRKKNGHYHWFRSTCKAVWDENGAVVRVVGSHADIHQSKVFTESLAQQEEKFKAVIRDDPNALFLVDATGEILLHSNRSVDVFGYSTEELSGMKIEDLLPSDKREVHGFHMKKFFEKPYTRSLSEGLELKGRKKNGLLFWIEVGLSPVSVEGETLVMAVVTDISKKKEAEKKLEQSYRQLNNLVNNLPGIVYQCRNDQYWTMDYISPACTQITGYDQKDFYGSPSSISYAQLIVPEEREEIWGHVQESLSRKAPFRVTYRIKDRFGQHKWIWEQGVGVFDEQGKVLGLEGCIFDISPLIKNQEKINQAIYNAEDKERRRIASDLHDGVQQILGASSLNLKVIEKDIEVLSEKVRKHYQKSLSFLAEGIREARSIAHRLMPKEVEQLGLNRAIEQLLMELKDNRGIEVNFYCNLGSRLSVEGELALYRVVQEAFNNIVKYSQATHVSIQLIAIENEVQLMIEDNGVGFDKNKIDLYSNGFGLSGMKNRIISLSGQLTVDSRPGRGTSIIAWLPKNLLQDGTVN